MDEQETKQLTDEEINAAAIKFAKRNKKSIARRLTNPTEYVPDPIPISVFMAGSPGAGKTEFSKNLISILEKDREQRVVRIDGDEIREYMPEYTGRNSHLFQGAVSIVIEKMHDLVLQNSQSFIFDSTFSQYEKAVENINRSLKKNRPVHIFYTYQEPKVAWGFTKAREKVEGRNIPKDAFIKHFLGARETIIKISEKFGEEIVIFFVKKDFELGTVERAVEIKPGVASIDDYIAERYTEDELEGYL